MKKCKTIITASFLGAVIFLAYGCNFMPQNIDDYTDISNFTPRQRHTTSAFNTVSALRLYDDFSVPENNARFDRVWREVLEILDELDSTLSHSSEDSYVAMFNALTYGESIEISLHMANVISIAKDMAYTTKGLFDPTIHPLVDLWGFTPRFNVNRFVPTYNFDRPSGRSELPDYEYIEAFLQLVDFSGIILEGNESEGFTLTKKIPPVIINDVTYYAKLDLGSILKGYATDLIVELLQSEGYKFGFFSCGGSSMGLLKGMDYIDRDNGIYLFELGLRRPRPGHNYLSSFITVQVQDMTISTSGDYDHAFFVDGIRYHHTFDPRTGWPTNTPVEYGMPQRGIASVSVIGSNDIPFVGTRTEVLSTVLLIMNLDEAIEFIDTLEDYKVVMVYYVQGYEYFEVITNICDSLLNILDTAYVLANF